MTKGRKRGWRAPDAMRAALNLRVSDATFAWLEQKTAATGLSMGAVIRQTLEWRMESEVGNSSEDQGDQQDQP